MFDVMAVYLGDRLGLYRALRDGGPATSRAWPARAGIDERYAREWLEQQAATGILDVDDVDAAPGDRRFSLPEAYAEPLLDRRARTSISPFGRSVVACAKVLPQLLDRVPDRWRRAVGGLWPGHDRVAGRLQPALAGQLVRVGDPARDPGRPRSPDGGPARPRRGCRVRRRLGGDRHRHARIRTCAWTASISTRRRSSSRGRTPKRRASRIA